MSTDQIPTTRLAPSPTGALHLGNARTFLINWAMARQGARFNEKTGKWQGGEKVVFRVEDLDGPRVKTGADAGAIDDLRWLGLDWDEGPYYQRDDLSRYQAALNSLYDKGLIYPCRCTRKDIRLALSAPNQGDLAGHETRYPGTCRDSDMDAKPVLSESSEDWTWRLRVPDEAIVFEDSVHGQISVNVQRDVGDFIVATKMGLPSYQLAVTLDDAHQGVTHVVRGDDLLGSTARQLLLYRFLELEPPTRWTHLPLVVGEDGRRLAKRHGDTRVSYYRDMGVPSAYIIGLLGSWSGMLAGDDEAGGDGQGDLSSRDDERNLGRTAHMAMDARTFSERFDLRRMGGEEVVFTSADHRWLMSGISDDKT
ncbi:Glutamate--tRNA ligase [Poriferisphaera corsica]|uniref:Glutamate--tRNA ligase n=1 Tax=Poriferisphaera corsica TaxID=2528020 RepID=A0A517YTK9_9BACT|nr:tRNA glutamyl-Q(34) synthetase GluQRS [Poriferisphaera corsica]QDU33570.1 Glutamate--tRNA ligase [Poriferisphaera corsica]